MFKSKRSVSGQEPSGCPQLWPCRFQGTAARTARDGAFRAGAFWHGGISIRLAGLVCCLFLLGLPAAWAGTDFTLTVQPLTEPAVAPGGTSAANLTVATDSTFSGTITFGCTVSPPTGVQGTINPTCSVSPASVSPAANTTTGASATITTTTDTSTLTFSIVITATDASGTVSSQPLNLTVLSVTPQFTITVETPVTPNRVPAGSGAQGTIIVTPVNGYTTPTGGGITLYCASITPLETIAPYCSFSYPNPDVPYLEVSSGESTQPVTVTINTLGPTVEGCSSNTPAFLWLSFPLFGLAVIGAGLQEKQSIKIWGIFGIFLVFALLALMPACSNSTTQLCSPNGVTPANTYTFTIVGIDSNGVASSNAGSGSTGPIVTLTVTTPTSQ